MLASYKKAIVFGVSARAHEVSSIFKGYDLNFFIQERFGETEDLFPGGPPLGHVQLPHPRPSPHPRHPPKHPARFLFLHLGCQV